MSAEVNKALVLQRLRSGALRLRSGWLPILQTAVAACLAWFLAVLILGLERPTFAPIAAVIVLGLAVGERRRPDGELDYLGRVDQQGAAALRRERPRRPVAPGSVIASTDRPSPRHCGRRRCTDCGAANVACHSSADRSRLHNRTRASLVAIRTCVSSSSHAMAVIDVAPAQTGSSCRGSPSPRPPATFSSGRSATSASRACQRPVRCHSIAAPAISPRAISPLAPGPMSMPSATDRL